MAKKLNPLTPNEKIAAEQKTYQAWLDRQALYNPAPEPDGRDLVHSNPAIARALTWAVSVIPGLLAAIVFTAILISADRTFAAFSGASAHKARGWSNFIGSLGVVFTEGSLVVTEFAAVRSRLQRNLPRQVWTVPKMLRGIGVRLGIKKPLDYDEMPDTNLERFSMMVFILILVANVFVAVTPLLEENGTSWVAMTDLARMYLVFAVFMGVVAPFGLKFVGSQLAGLSYELYAQQQEEMRREMQAQWKANLMTQWAEEGPELVAQALHERYVIKNGLQPGGSSPYLLTTSVDEEGKADLTAVPLASSSMNSAAPSSPLQHRANGSQ